MYQNARPAVDMHDTGVRRGTASDLSGEIKEYGERAKN